MSSQSGLSTTTTWGLPTCATPSAPSSVGPSVTGPMSTLPVPTSSLKSSVTILSPAKVLTRISRSERPVARRTAATRQRIPLPDISAIVPSALYRIMEIVDPTEATIKPSAPTPEWRSHTARAREESHHGDDPCSTTSTRKSFPAPCHFCNQRSAIFPSLARSRWGYSEFHRGAWPRQRGRHTTPLADHAGTTTADVVPNGDSG